MNKQTLTQQIEFILSTTPESRNSDITLTMELWQHYYKDLFIYSKSGKPFVALERLFDLPREDNIKRIRAKIQNEERRYLPTNVEVLIERAKLSKEWKEFFGYNVNWGDEDWGNAIANYFTGGKNKQGSLL